MTNYIKLFPTDDNSISINNSSYSRANMKVDPNLVTLNNVSTEFINGIQLAEMISHRSTPSIESNVKFDTKCIVHRFNTAEPEYEKLLETESAADFHQLFWKQCKEDKVKITKRYAALLLRHVLTYLKTYSMMDSKFNLTQLISLKVF